MDKFAATIGSTSSAKTSADGRFFVMAPLLGQSIDCPTGAQRRHAKYLSQILFLSASGRKDASNA